MNRAPLTTVRLCLVTDRALGRNRPLADVVGQAVQGGVTMVQLREKRAATRAFVAEAAALRQTLQALGVPLIINDRADVALAVGADGVHVGQDDMPVATLRALLGPAALIGLSITSDADLRRPDADAADYLGIGPVFPQNTKPDGTTPLGLDGFARLRRATAKPVLAIGGMTPDTAAVLIQAGANGLAVVSAIMAAADPAAAARAFRAAMLNSG